LTKGVEIEEVFKQHILKDTCLPLDNILLSDSEVTRKKVDYKEFPLLRELAFELKEEESLNLLLNHFNLDNKTMISRYTQFPHIDRSNPY
jgi:hypothetical protein